MGNWQTVQTQIWCPRSQRLIKLYTVCKKVTEISVEYRIVKNKPDTLPLEIDQSIELWQKSLPEVNG